MHETFGGLVRSGNAEGLYRLLKGLPKGGLLHVHLSGAIPVDTVLSDAESRRFYMKYVEGHAEFRKSASSRIHPRVRWLDRYYKKPKYAIISSREWEQLKRETLYLRQRGLLGRRQQPQWYYKRVCNLDDLEREELREALLFREAVPAAGAPVAIGPGYRPTLISLPEEFEKRFARLDSITGDPWTMRKMLRVVLDRLWKDNVSYVEIIVNPFDKIAPSEASIKQAFGTRTEFEGYDELKNVIASRYRFDMLCAEHILRRYIDEVNSFNSNLRRLARDDKGRRDLPKRLDARFLLGLQRGAIRRRERLQQCFELVSRFRTVVPPRYHDRLLGINLVGDEFRGRPSDYLEWIPSLLSQYAGKVHLSLHAGESAVDDGHVLDAVLLGAERIGHGLSLKYSPRAEELVASRGICVEACLLSNKLLGFVPNVEKHPARRWLAREMPVCLNTDDPGIFGISMTDEFYYAVCSFDLGLADIQRLCMQSLNYSFLPSAEKSEAINEFVPRLNEYVERYS